MKLSTYGASAAAGIVALLTLLDPTFNAVFGNSSSPWLKLTLFAVVIIVWGAVMVADTLARKAPINPVAKVSSPQPDETEGAVTDDMNEQLHQLLKHAAKDMHDAEALVPK